MSKKVEPSIKETAFSCPYCDAFTTQHWYQVRANEPSGKQDTPFDRIGAEGMEAIAAYGTGSPIYKEYLSNWEAHMVYLKDSDSQDTKLRVGNLHLSRCYNCNKIAVWVHESLVFPALKNGSIPNADLSDEIKRDFEEARCIVESSPRGAAALLRLCVQKLCIQLGESGKNIDADIASLVSKGLNPQVQQAMDVVRVVGNQAVHPGEINLNDNREIALRLFELINLIADQLISNPKKVSNMYAKLPIEKTNAIDRRNNKVKPMAEQD